MNRRVYNDDAYGGARYDVKQMIEEPIALAWLAITSKNRQTSSEMTGNYTKMVGKVTCAMTRR